jgi:hypothetical protein
MDDFSVSRSMHFVFILYIGLFVFYPSGPKLVPPTKALEALEDSMIVAANRMQMDSLALDRHKAARDLNTLLESALKVEGAESYPFDRIPQVSVLPLEESNMRLFTFQVTLDQNRTIQYGYLQFTDAPAAYRVLRLNKDYPLDLMQRSFTAKDWIGAVYYKSMPVKSRKQTYWLLFGFDEYGQNTNRKILDVLYLDEQNEPVFGKPVLEYHDQKGEVVDTKHRLVLEYASNARVRLNFDEHFDLILFDHLIPEADPGRPNQIRFIPDGTYSGFKRQKDRWVFVEKAFHEVMDEAPVNFPVLEGRKEKDIFGRQKK